MNEKEQIEDNINFRIKLIEANERLLKNIKLKVSLQEMEPSIHIVIEWSRLYIETLEIEQKIKFQTNILNDWKNRLHNWEIDFEKESQECNLNYKKILEISNANIKYHRISSLMDTVSLGYKSQAEKNKLYKSMVNELKNAKIVIR